MRDPWNYVREVEEEYGVTIEEYPLDILCGNTGCWIPECDCWDNLKSALDTMAREKADEAEASERTLGEVLTALDEVV